MAAYITADDVKPRLLGYSQLTRAPADLAVGNPSGTDADGFPTRYLSVLDTLIAGTIAAIDNCLHTEFDGTDAQRRLFWTDGQDWDISLPRARQITTLELRAPLTGETDPIASEMWEPLPAYDTKDSDGIRRLRKLGEDPWQAGEYWITADWGYSLEEVPADIKDGAADQVHYRFSMLPGMATTSLQLTDGGEVRMYGGLLWSGQMYGTLMHHATARGLA